MEFAIAGLVAMLLVALAVFALSKGGDPRFALLILGVAVVLGLIAFLRPAQNTAAVAAAAVAGGPPLAAEVAAAQNLPPGESSEVLDLAQANTQNAEAELSREKARALSIFRDAYDFHNTGVVADFLLNNVGSVIGLLTCAFVAGLIVFGAILAAMTRHSAA